MLLRREQLEAFEQNASVRFEAELVRHMFEFAPELCALRGEPAIKDVVRTGIAAAERFGFVNRGPVTLFVEIMFNLGCEFTSDVQAFWAVSILNSAEPDQQVKAARLYERSLEYRELVSGPGDEFAIAALQRVRLFAGNTAATPAAASATAAWIEDGLAAAFPQKCTFIGAEAVRVLAQEGIAAAGERSITIPEGAAVLAGLMFAFGHGILRDPLYPWVASSLNSATIADPNERLQLLRRRSLIYLDRVLENRKRQTANALENNH